MYKEERMLRFFNADMLPITTVDIDTIGKKLKYAIDKSHR